MSLGYGSNIPLSALSRAQVGYISEIKQSKSGIWALLAGVLTGIITIATAGAGAGFGIALGVGLAGASINTGVTAAESGSINPTMTAIDFGAALIPGIGGIKNLANAGTKVGLEIANTAGVAFEEVGKQSLTTAAKYGQKQTLAQIFNSGFKHGSESMVSALINYPGYAEFAKTFADAFGGTASSAGIAGAAGIEAGTDIASTTKRNALSAGLTIEEIERIAELTADIFSDAEKKLAAIRYLKSIGKLDSIPFLSKLTDEGIVALIEGFEKQIVRNPFKEMIRKFVRALAHPSSSEFNEIFVQRIQLLFDGSDAGRAPIESVYKQIKNYIEKEFKALAKILNKANKLDKAFEATGGLLVNSEVIIGYKEVEELNLGGQKLLQITFYPEPTKSQKNPNGKEPVFVFASKKQRKRLRNEGMGYYLKTWATSKNGRGLLFESGIKSIFGGLTFFTGFFKMNSIRNILSLASNMSTGFFGKGGISEHGMFTGAWEKKFAESFSRNWKNRVGRLGGRAIVGGAAKVFFGNVVGSFIGQEAQRAASQYIVPALTGNKIGDYKAALLTSLSSNVRRASRAHTQNLGVRNFALENLSNQRKGQIIQRTPGSFSAGYGALSQWRVKIPR